MCGRFALFEPDKAVIETCTILTTAANAVLAPVHDRMPVIIPPREYDRWLDPSLKDDEGWCIAPLPQPHGLLRPDSPLFHFPDMYTNIHT